MSEPFKVCGIPGMVLPPCDLEWGHDGDIHSNAGDGFYGRAYLDEHRRRQAERRERMFPSEKCEFCGSKDTFRLDGNFLSRYSEALVCRSCGKRSGC